MCQDIWYVYFLWIFEKMRAVWMCAWFLNEVFIYLFTFFGGWGFFLEDETNIY